MIDPCQAKLPWASGPCGNRAEVYFEPDGRCCRECVDAITDGRWYQVPTEDGLPEYAPGLPLMKDGLAVVARTVEPWDA